MKRHVFVLVTFFFLIILSVCLFTCGLLVKDTHETAFVFLVAATCFCFSGGMILIAVNVKALRQAEMLKFGKKLASADFTDCKAEADSDNVREALLAGGFSEIAENNFLRKTYENIGDSDLLTYMHILIRKIDGLSDIGLLLQECKSDDAALMNFPVYILIIKDRFDDNVKAFKQYMAEAFAYIKSHPFSGKQYFYPILVYNKKVYYMKNSSFTHDYRETIEYALKLLNAIPSD